MTREELKEHCQRQIQQFERVEKIMPVTSNDWKRYEEHKLILELLEQEPCEDAISRQEVLEYIEGSWAELGHSSENELVCQDIKEMPSVTPKQQTCEDTVSRQEAIKLIQKYGVGCFDAEEFSPEQCERFVISKLNSLPPVTPQHNTGHWIENAPEWQIVDPPYICSECGNFHLLKTNYCDQCGAKMVENEIHCNYTDAEIAKSFIEDVEAVKDLLPRTESEGK